MASNLILDEVQRVKDELAREAGNDLHQLCENTRQWAAAHPRQGPAARNAAELREYFSAREAVAPDLREEPPPYGSGQNEVVP